MKLFGFFLVLLIVISPIATSGQDKASLKQTESTIFAANGRIPWDLYQEPDGTYFSVSRVMWHLVVSLFDKDLNFIEKKHVKLKIRGTKYTPEKIVRIGNEYVLFLSYNDTKKGEASIFHTSFYPTSFEFSPNLTLIATVDNEKHQSFEVVTSDDGSKVLIASVPETKTVNQTDAQRGTPVHLNCWVLNQNLSIVYQLQNQLIHKSKPDQTFKLRELALDTDGTIYVLSQIGYFEYKRVLHKKELQGPEKALTSITTTYRDYIEYKSSTYTLQKFGFEKGAERSYTTHSSDLYIDMKFIIDSREIHLVGLIWDKRKMREISGTVRDDQLISTVKHEVLDKKELMQLTSNTLDRQLANYNTVSSCALTNAGDLLFAIERCEIHSVRRADGRTIDWKREYAHGRTIFGGLWNNGFQISTLEDRQFSTGHPIVQKAVISSKGQYIYYAFPDQVVSVIKPPDEHFSYKVTTTLRDADPEFTPVFQKCLENGEHLSAHLQVLKCQLIKTGLEGLR